MLGAASADVCPLLHLGRSVALNLGVRGYGRKGTKAWDDRQEFRRTACIAEGMCRFDTVGMTVQYVAAAALTCESAVLCGIGVAVPHFVSLRICRSRRPFMRRLLPVLAVAIALFPPAALARQAGTDGPYKVLKTARVGGEGGSDYIYAEVIGRRLYIPRGGRRAVPATDTTPAVPAEPGRITVFNLDTLEPVGEIPATGGNGVAVDPKSGHGFSSSKPVSMFDTKTLKLIKTIDVGAAQPDGILFDAFNDRVYAFSHPT
jgi:hypothetical protein